MIVYNHELEYKKHLSRIFSEKKPIAIYPSRISGESPGSNAKFESCGGG
jgi:hypothetical protein